MYITCINLFFLVIINLKLKNIMSNETTTPWNHNESLEGASGVNLDSLEQRAQDWAVKTFEASEEDKKLGKTSGKISEATESMENAFSKRELAILATQLTYDKLYARPRVPSFEEFLDMIGGKK